MQDALEKSFGILNKYAKHTENGDLIIEENAVKNLELTTIEYIKHTLKAVANFFIKALNLSEEFDRSKYDDKRKFDIHKQTLKNYAKTESDSSISK